ncbi:MAG: 30S ribosomal protein S20 [bacterium]|nr:30S ribosomal protein S20 [bacterium]
MANHKSALKEHRQALIRRARNRYNRARMRTAVRACRKAIDEGDADQAKTLLRGTLSLLDRTVKLGALHDNAAARTKSRLTRAVNRMSAGA